MATSARAQAQPGLGSSQLAVAPRLAPAQAHASGATSPRRGLSGLVSSLFFCLPASSGPPASTGGSRGQEAAASPPLGWGPRGCRRPEVPLLVEKAQPGPAACAGLRHDGEQRAPRPSAVPPGPRPCAQPNDAREGGGASRRAGGTEKCRKSPGGALPEEERAGAELGLSTAPGVCQHGRPRCRSEAELGAVCCHFVEKWVERKESSSRSSAGQT